MSDGTDGLSFPTSLGTSSADQIRLLGQDLTADLMGQVSFGELAFWLVALRRPSPSETRVFEAVLVALADHGFTPSAIAARLTLTGTAPFLPHLVDAEAIRDVGARIEFRIAGAPRFTLVLDHGRAALEPADGRCDCWISAEPVPYLLLAYNRIGRWRPLLRREVRAGGRRRGLAMRLPRYLTAG